MFFNNLFNKSSLKEKLGKFENKLNITNTQKEVILAWAGKLENKERVDERGNYINFANEILTKLLSYTNDTDFKNDVKFDKTFVDFVLYKNNKPFVVIELKGSEVDLDKRIEGKMSPVEQGFNYASKTSDAKWVIISNYNEFRLYNKKTQEKYISFTIEDLKDFDNLKLFLMLFSKEFLINKDLATELLKNTIFIEENLEAEFYKLFSETRLMLIAELEYSGINKNDAIHYSQIILNRYIFICFSEDLGLLPSELSIETLMTPIKHKNLFKTTLWNRLNELFLFINEGNPAKKIHEYNGGLFKEDISHIIIRDIVEDFSIFKNCYQKWKFEDKYSKIDGKIGDAYKNKINPIFKNLLVISTFDFSSEMDVNILGHIFENSIGDLEELKDGIGGKRKKDGIFYTPDYITDYICKNTIIPYLSNVGGGGVE
ncbi:MAG: type I restriction endonuclease [Methanobacteriaceae archaeon]